MLTLYYAINDNHVYMHVHVHVHACITSRNGMPVDYYSKQLGRTIHTCHPGHNWLCRLGGRGERGKRGREGGEYTSTSSLPCNLLFITTNFGALVTTV